LPNMTANHGSSQVFRQGGADQGSREMLWTLWPTARGRHKPSPEADGCLQSEGLRWLNRVISLRWRNGCWVATVGCRAAPDPGSGEPPAGSADEPRRSATCNRQPVGCPFQFRRGRPGCPCRGSARSWRVHGEPAAPAHPCRPGWKTATPERSRSSAATAPASPRSGLLPGLAPVQRLRGPYNTIQAGLAAYQEDLGLAPDRGRRAFLEGGEPSSPRG